MPLFGVSSVMSPFFRFAVHSAKEPRWQAKEQVVMRRDWDLIRHLLREIEEKPDTRPGKHTAEPHPESTVACHLELLADAGRIDGIRAAGDAYDPRSLPSIPSALRGGGTTSWMPFAVKRCGQKSRGA